MDLSMNIILGLLPFITFPFAFSPYEVPKTWAIALAAVISGGVFIIRNREKEVNKPLLFVLLILWGWIIGSSLSSGYFWESWLGNPYRSDGLFTLTALIMLGITIKFNLKLINILGWGASVLTVLTILTWGGSMLTLGNLNFLAGYLAITLPFVQNRFRELLQFGAIILIGSWGGILVGALFFAIKYLGNKKKYLLLCVALVCGYVGVQYYQGELARDGELLNAESRERIFTKAAKAIRQQPLFGWGWAQFSRSFKQIDWPVHYSADVYVDRTHASILEYGVAGGIPALIAFGYLAVNACLILYRSKTIIGRTMGLVGILYLVQSQTNVTSVVQDWLFFAAVGEAIKQ